MTVKIIQNFLISVLMSCILASWARGSRVEDLEEVEKISIVDIDDAVSNRGYLTDNKSYIYNIFDENNTVYDQVFWIVLASFIVFVVYVRARINFRLDYPDEEETPFYSALIKYRTIIAPDPYLDPERKKLDLMSVFDNGPLIAFTIIWYSVGFFSLGEVFDATYEHIEDLNGLAFALFIYFINIIGCCIVFDICATAPMKYYEE